MRSGGDGGMISRRDAGSSTIPLPRFLLWATASALFIAGWWALYPFIRDRHDITLRTWTEYVGEEAVRSERVKEWRFKLPKQFGVSRYRSWTEPAFDLNERSTDQGGQSIRLNSRLTAQDEVVAYTGSGDANLAFGLSISNGLLDEYRSAQSNYCLTYDDIQRIRAQRSADQGRTRQSQCRDSSVNCRIWLNYHGWEVNVGVSRTGLYLQPERVCGILRKTLDAWTISIDDLRRKPNNER